MVVLVAGAVVIVTLAAGKLLRTYILKKTPITSLSLDRGKGV